MGSLDNQIAFITAGAQGLGRAIAVEMARAGANIVIAQRQFNKVSSVVKEIESLGREVLAVEMDVRDPQAVKRGVEQALERFPKIDILVNNAGCGENIDQETTVDDFVQSYDVNVIGIWRLVSALKPHFKANRGARIINIASIAGRGGSATLPAYCASKSAAINLTQSLAAELGPHNITVNAICPGTIRTEQGEHNAEVLGLSDQQAFEDHVKTITLLQCVMSPEDIAHAAVFFASPYAKNITGQSLNVDGGIVLS